MKGQVVLSEQVTQLLVTGQGKEFMLTEIKKYDTFIFIPLWVYVLYQQGGIKMRQCMDADNLHRRLNKIMGQIRAIDKMVDEDIPCEDMLIQINAVKSALHKVGQVVLEGHLNHCVREGIEHGDADKTIADFAKAVEHFSRMS